MALCKTYMASGSNRPSDQIDHINCITTDNRIENLREAHQWQNSANRGRNRNNKSGFKGVYWNAKIEKWIATIKVSRNVVYLGTFTLPEDAHAEYAKAAKMYFGEFAKVG